MPPPPFVAHCGFGALLLLTSIPLALRLVPPNRAYGIRIPKAFASPQNWYAINAFGGWVLGLYGLFCVVYGVALRDKAPPPQDLWSVPFTIGPLLGVFIPLAIIMLWARRL
jgi:hypothetical protein